MIPNQAFVNFHLHVNTQDHLNITINGKINMIEKSEKSGKSHFRGQRICMIVEGTVIHVDDTCHFFN